jgi:hypothetical protein
VVEFAHHPTRRDILLDLVDGVFEDLEGIDPTIGVGAIGELELAAQFQDCADALFFGNGLDELQGHGVL